MNRKDLWVSQGDQKATAEVVHVVKSWGLEGKIKKRGALEIGSFAQTEMDMEFVIESEVGQKGRKKSHILMHVCGI